VHCGGLFCSRLTVPIFSLIVSSLTFTGCSLVGTAPAGDGFSGHAPGGGLAGNAFGGRQPIAGADVYAYVAGKTGYGSPAHQLAHTTTAKDGTGSFNLNGAITCPAANDPAYSETLYLTIAGGDAGGGVNSASLLLAVLGDCPAAVAAQPVVVINEASTFAGMTALQQFYNPSTGSFGTSASNIAGLVHAASTVSNLVNLQGYSGPTVLTGTAASVAGTTVKATPESAKIYSAANVLAACVNSAGAASAPCTALFSSVNWAAVANTLQAAYYMASNPTDAVGGVSNMASVYGLGTANPPYGAGLRAAPSDWTVGIAYSSTSQTPGTVYLFNNPAYPAVDAAGNIWWINAYAGYPNAAGNSLIEISPVGVPLAQALIGTATSAATTSIWGGHSLAIDPSGNIWAANLGSTTPSADNTVGYQSNVLEYIPGSGAVNTFPVGNGPATLASDEAGNIFIADSSTVLAGTTAPTGHTVGGGALMKLPHGAASGTAPALIDSGISQTSAGSLALDSCFNVWLPSGHISVKEYLANTEYTSANSQTANNPQNVVIDADNNAWIANGSSPSLVLMQANNSTAPLAVLATYVGGGLSNSMQEAIDGAGNIWVTNASSASTGSVSEFNTHGAAISPTTTGFAKTTEASNPAAYFFAGAAGIAVDSAGNVWVGNTGSAGSPSEPGGVLTEIVGAAAPAITPIAAGLPATAGGVSKLATRP